MSSCSENSICSSGKSCKSTVSALKAHIIFSLALEAEQVPNKLAARDVLAIQVSTVASESAFSAGGRVIDPFRSRLDPDMVETLVCSKDWIAASRKGSQKYIESIFVDLEALGTLAANMVDEVEEEMDSDED